ncbi:MAG: polysaccharide deacetylase family protein [Clostridium sp.]|uniref:polysaccharide deacetylase family protein n=1 Tax=Clostridium sp. TaxID=1506 RepID=UPI00290A2C3D|nr:polysaccharide deacetylase family protein [Clostridium sp.]MDU5110231.1 polysaccharide deacetylase family protein [Clostridium sp.]
MKRRSTTRRSKKVKYMKKYILFLTILFISTFAIFTFVNKFRHDITETKADIIDNNSDEKETAENDSKSDDVINKDIEGEENEDDLDIENNMPLDNSGYLALEEDINADDASVVVPETMYKWNFYREDNKKIAYLTFDDGPSEHSTEKILDILNANDIKATFFTLGSSIERNPRSEEILKRMAKEGHAIASHGYSHEYSILYPNRTVDVQAFLNDFEKNDKLLKDKLGKDFSTRLIRLPGGHSSWNGTAALDVELENRGIIQVDWNSLNGDAEGYDKPKEVLLENLQETVLDQDVVIVLMHDTDMKKGTVDYLQSAIDYLRGEGFEFRTLK